MPSQASGNASRAARRRAIDSSGVGAMGSLKRRQPAAQRPPIWSTVASGAIEGG